VTVKVLVIIAMVLLGLAAVLQAVDTPVSRAAPTLAYLGLGALSWAHWPALAPG
jgi:hypothetical protein